MFRLVRTAISFVVVLVMIWAAFAVDLGGHTFAEHIDAISETPEAEQLIEGTRSRVNPALQEARDRVLGEYVEAPTWIPSEVMPPRSPTAQPTPPREHTTPAATTPASTLPPEQRFEPSLPGRRRTVADDGGHEPGLPGRR